MILGLENSPKTTKGRFYFSLSHVSRNKQAELPIQKNRVKREEPTNKNRSRASVQRFVDYKDAKNTFRK